MFAKKIKLAQNLYVDSEDFRDKLEHEGMVCEEDMLPTYRSKGTEFTLIDAHVDEAYYDSAEGDLYFDHDRYMQWKHKNVFIEIEE